MRQLAAVAGDEGQRAGKMIHDFSSQFQREFVSLLSRRFGTRRVLANQVYQEFIRERHHLHMNATRWVSLSEFVKHLGRSGIAKVEASDLGWFIEWIDTSTTALARQDALRKMERTKVDDEQRTRKLIDEQIHCASELANPEEIAKSHETEERRAEGIQRTTAAPVRLSLSAAKDTPTSMDTTAGSDTAKSSEHGALDTGTGHKTANQQNKPTVAPAQAPAPALAPAAVSPFPVRPAQAPTTNPPKANPLKANPLKANPLKANPLKANPLKSAEPAAKSKVPGAPKRPPPSHLGAAERIIMEEQAARERRKRGPEIYNRSEYGPVKNPTLKRSRF